jgi:hypothetical protein
MAFCFEPDDIGGRLSRGLLTQNPGQGFAKISTRDPLEIKGRNQCVNARSSAHILGQNGTGKLPSISMTDARLTDFDWSNAADDFPFRQVTVAYHQALSILIPAILMELNVLDNLVFYRCLQKLARSFLQ